MAELEWLQIALGAIPPVIVFALVFICKNIVNKGLAKQILDFQQLIKSNTIVNAMAEIKKYIAALPPEMVRLKASMEAVEKHYKRLTSANIGEYNTQIICDLILKELRPHIEKYMQEIAQGLIETEAEE